MMSCDELRQFAVVCQRFALNCDDDEKALRARTLASVAMRRAWAREVNGGTRVLRRRRARWAAAAVYN